MQLRLIDPFVTRFVVKQMMKLSDVAKNCKWGVCVHCAVYVLQTFANWKGVCEEKQLLHQ